MPGTLTKPKLAEVIAEMERKLLNIRQNGEARIQKMMDEIEDQKAKTLRKQIQNF